MGVRSLMIAAGTLLLVQPASAEPVKAPVQKAEQPSDAPAPVIVAAADTVVAAEPKDQVAAVPQPKPVRHARVTTCRCGDQTHPGD